MKKYFLLMLVLALLVGCGSDNDDPRVEGRTFSSAEFSALFTIGGWQLASVRNVDASGTEGDNVLADLDGFSVPTLVCNGDRVYQFLRSDAYPEGSDDYYVTITGIYGYDEATGVLSFNGLDLPTESFVVVMIDGEGMLLKGTPLPAKGNTGYTHALYHFKHMSQSEVEQLFREWKVTP